MDRLKRTFAGCGLALLAAAGGCRSAHDDVPPGKGYRPDAAPGSASSVGFSTSPPNKAPGSFGPGSNLTPGNLGGPLGSRVPGGDQTGNFPGSQFGAPGTSGAAPSSAPASSSSMAPPPQTGAFSGLGQAPALGQPSGGAAPREEVNYLNGFPTQPTATGVMGSPGQPPSPL
jgi:hypothetical protein